MSRVEIDPSWRENVGAAVTGFLDERLGPAIADDARRFCPRRSGDLAESVEHHMEGETLIVGATGSDERWYAYYVEMGTHEHEVTPDGKKALFWPGARHPVARVTIPDIPPRPFLRPALYKERSEE